MTHFLQDRDNETYVFDKKISSEHISKEKDVAPFWKISRQMVISGNISTYPITHNAQSKNIRMILLQTYIEGWKCLSPMVQGTLSGKHGKDIFIKLSAWGNQENYCTL